ncbi:carbon storage regulator CsrA [Chengkuizengella axinellae]|uniref:Translational regulator CsrA n=1 Tax=Chengkuizengella axinellae TaxID=3064388 RepID=A0ABT9J2P2_9BACL|nr:carbon storage regulator CsrA [Chengkuizengella sp. 2205SS18-9]MDP5275886.1 carbon storage regulator CsrA [Chengkuizengella sp. 2205SS18-9]
MLVLTRKTGQSIMIGDEIELTIIEAEGETVKVGISAPKEIQVYRMELYESIKQSNQEAASITIDPTILKNLFQKKQ